MRIYPRSPSCSISVLGLPLHLWSSSVGLLWMDSRVWPWSVLCGIGGGGGPKRRSWNMTKTKLKSAILTWIPASAFILGGVWTNAITTSMRPPWYLWHNKPHDLSCAVRPCQDLWLNTFNVGCLYSATPALCWPQTQTPRMSALA